MMNRSMVCVLALGLLLLSSTAHAATYYVATNGSDAAAGTNWLTAKQTIQAGIDAASSGNTVLVSNGVYATGGRAVVGTMTNRIVLDKPVTVASVNGPVDTIIRGQACPTNSSFGDGAVRCAWMTNGSSLVGFTLTNGYTRTTVDDAQYSGGGVWCASTGATISNCVLTGNAACGNAGASYGGSLYNCEIIGNRGDSVGGSLYGVLWNCKLIGNVGYGGGWGGGANNSDLYNCLIINNSARHGGGTHNARLYNCTVVSNSASFVGGGVDFGSANNTVIYFNSGGNVGDSCTLTYCCASPLPSGTGNISSNPALKDMSGGDYSLATNSPCINVGTNQTWMTNTFDLAGNPRIQNSIVDMGAYEYTETVATSYLLTVYALAGGSVSITGGTYSANSNVQIVATASNGYHFVNWTGDVTSAYATTNILMSTNKTVWANFAYDYTYTTNNGNIFIDGYSGTGGVVFIPSTINGMPVYHINGFAFVNQFSLTGITIPDGVTYIGDMAFYGCCKLTSLTIPSSVARIAGQAFEHCFSLTHVTLPSGVISIGGSAFRSCTGLQSITIPSSVASIGGWAFKECNGLINVFFHGPAPSLGSDVFLGDDNATVYYLSWTTNWGSMFGGRPTAIWNPNALSVVSAYGTPTPGGVTTNSTGANLTNSVSGSPVNAGTTQYVNTGWTMTGNEPGSGSGSTLTMTVTNAATLTWLWKTQVQFTATAGANGSISGSANGWYDFGGSVTVTAVPNAHYHFAGWGGDVSGDSNALVVTLTLDNARSVTANFAIDQHTLTVGTSYGIATPSGSAAYDYGTILTNSVIGSPVNNGTTQYINTGWAMTSNEPGSGSGASLIMTLTNGADLNWLWITNFSLAASAGANGVVTGTVNGWYAQGASVSVTATPDWHYAFAGWSGDVSGDTNNPVLSMTMDRPLNVTASFVFSTSLAWTNYVAKTGGHVAPFETWAKAATNIQSAVDAVFSGDVVIVSNGTYNTGGRVAGGQLLTNRVVITNAITLQSVNGPTVTVIAGQGPIGDAAVRPVFLGSNSFLTGFTMTNGYTRASTNTADGYGGGIYCASTSSVVSNCVISGNFAYYRGGGAYNGKYNDSQLRGNRTTWAGPGGDWVYYTYGSHGGGVYSGTLYRCTLSNNYARYVGGGSILGTLVNCTIVNNSSAYEGGGVDQGTLYGCIIKNNYSLYGGGVYDQAKLYNCVVYGNSAGSYGGGVAYAQMFNCIVYSNSSPAPIIALINATDAVNTCSSPLLSGVGCISNDPQFVNAATGDFRLKTNSPCINTGTNQAWMVGTVDLDGNPRIVRRTVDMGAYESQYLPTWTIRTYGSPNGSILPTGDVYVVDGNGTNFQIQASTYYHLGAIQTNNGLVALTNTVTMTVVWTNIITNGSIAMSVVENLAVSNTPEWWLAAHGWTSDFDAAATNDADGDTLPNWLEYRGRTDPTDSNSWLAVFGASNSLVGTTGVVVRWYSVAGKNYFIDRTTNLLQSESYQNVKSNIAGTVGYMSYMDTNAPVSRLLFYRVGVE